MRRGYFYFVTKFALAVDAKGVVIVGERVFIDRWINRLLAVAAGRGGLSFVHGIKVEKIL